VGCWHGYLSGVRCRFAYGPADATATHYLLLQDWFYLPGFTFLVLAQPVTPLAVLHNESNSINAQHHFSC